MVGMAIHYNYEQLITARHYIIMMTSDIIKFNRMINPLMTPTFNAEHSTSIKEFSYKPHGSNLVLPMTLKIILFTQIENKKKT